MRLMLLLCAAGLLAGCATTGSVQEPARSLSHARAHKRHDGLKNVVVDGSLVIDIDELDGDLTTCDRAWNRERPDVIFYDCLGMPLMQEIRRLDKAFANQGKVASIVGHIGPDDKPAGKLVLIHEP